MRKPSRSRNRVLIARSMSIKGRQVAGVTTLVVVIVAALSAYHLATLARLSLQESAVARRAAHAGDLPARARSRAARRRIPTRRCARTAASARSCTRASATRRNVVYAAIVNKRRRRRRAQLSHPKKASRCPSRRISAPSSIATPIALLRIVYSDRTFEIRQPLLLRRPASSASIRIGISTHPGEERAADGVQAGAAERARWRCILSTLVAMLLAQWMLRPIHVIQSGLTRLGRGELDVRLDLPEGSEFKDLGSSFDAVSAQLSESRAKALSPRDRLRVGRRQPRGRRRAVQPRRQARCSATRR